MDEVEGRCQPLEASERVRKIYHMETAVEDGQEHPAEGLLFQVEGVGTGAIARDEKTSDLVLTTQFDR